MKTETTKILKIFKIKIKITLITKLIIGIVTIKIILKTLTVRIIKKTNYESFMLRKKLWYNGLLIFLTF